MAGKLLYPGAILALTTDAADRLLASSSGDCALLYLHLLRQNGKFQPDYAAKVLKWPPERTQAAFDALVKLGLADRRELKEPEPEPQLPPSEPPTYTAADLAQELENKDSPFPALVSEVQRRLGKILSAADLNQLYTLYDFLALPAEVILLLVNWCVEEMERKYGEGRKPRMAQISKAGFTWRRKGIDTADAAEAYLRRQSLLNTRTASILPLLDIKGRPPVDAERRYLTQWIEMGFADEVIRMAYERTVLKTQSMSWPYMNSILKSWHQKGLHTPEAVLAQDSTLTVSAAPTVNPPAPAAPGEADRRVREDLERMRAYLRAQQAKEGE